MSAIDNALQNLLKIARKKIIWENASPASDFPAQKISVALNANATYVVEVAYSTSTPNTILWSAPTKIGERVCVIGVGGIDTPDNLTVRQRIADTAVDGFDFSAAYTTASSRGFKDNIAVDTHLIPLRIYELYDMEV